MRRLAAVAALLVLAACGSDGSAGPTGSRGPDEGDATSPAATSSTAAPAASGPEAAVESLMRALDAGDCRAARAIVVTPAALDCEVVGQAKDSFADEGIDIDEIVYEAGTTYGSSSKVTITWGNEYPDESYEVERIDGTWRVVFDSEA